AHGLGTVVARERLALAETIRYGGDVTQQDTPVGSRTAGGLLCDDDTADLVHRLQLADRAQRVAVAAAPDRAARCARVGALERRLDLCERDAIALHARMIHVHLDLALETAGHGGFRDTIDLFEPAAEDRLGYLLQVPETDRTGHTERHDRFAARVRAQHDRTCRALRQDTAQAVDLFAHVERGEVHVRAPGETQHDERRTLARG